MYRVFCFQIFIEKEEDVYNVNSYIYNMESLSMEHITISFALTNVEGWIFEKATDHYDLNPPPQD